MITAAVTQMWLVGSNFVSTFVLCYILTEVLDMYNVNEVIQVISIGLIVASILINTNRFLRAIELCKECLLILKEKAGIKDKKLSKLFYKRIYFTMWRACSVSSDNTNAIKYAEKLLQIYRESGERLEECKLSIELTGMYFHDSKHAQVKQLSEKALLISKEIGDSKLEACCYGNLGAVYQSVGEYEKAREHLEKSLAIQEEIEDRRGEAASYGYLGTVYTSVGEYEKAREHLEKSLVIHKEIGNRNGEATSCGNLGTVYQSVGEYEKARKHLEKSLAIQKEIEDRRGEATSYASLGAVFQSVGEYETAREYLEKSLVIQKEIGNRRGEAICYTNLGTVYQSVGEYEKAREHLENSLAIQEEIGDRRGEATSYTNLGAVFQSVGEYEKAKEHLEKSIVIQKEIRNRRGEAICYTNLGTVYQSVGEYEKAREHLEKSLAIQKEIGDRREEAICYTNLGTVYQSVGEHEKAREHLEKSLVIQREIGNRRGEAICYTNLGTVYQSVDEYEKAREHLEKSLVIQKEIGDRRGEAICYTNLGTVYQSVGEYENAREHLEKSLVIQKEIGDRRGEAICYTNLGTVYQSVDEYEKAREHLEKSLVIQKEIGNRRGEAICYTNLGTVYQSVGEYEKAREHLEKSLAIQKEIGDRRGEGMSYANLGSVYTTVGEYEKASHYNKKSLAISSNIGDRHKVALSYLTMGAKFHSLGKYSCANEYNKKAFVILRDIGDRQGVASFYLNQGGVELAVGNLIKAKEYYENALAISKDIGNRKTEAAGYLSLGHFFFAQSECDRADEYINKALTLSEKIGDIAMQYHSLEVMAHIRIKEGNIQQAVSYIFSGIEKCEEMRNSLRDNDQFKISFSDRNIRSYRDLSVLLFETGNPTEAVYVSELSRGRALADLMSARYSVENQISANPRTWAGLESIVGKECNGTCLHVSYHSGSIYLWILKAGGVTHFQRIKGKDVIGLEGLGQQLEEFLDSRSFGQGPKMNLPICYKLVIAPVTKFLEGPEIIIVPDRALYNIPFAALADETGMYLSETFRIRLVPSLRTLKLINESPADYHCQTGALIVGNPDVGEVHFKGRLVNICRLPCTENEARMVGEKLGVEPLLGQQATKQAVLQAMNSVALIHIAAHGDAERGEIALAPSFRIPNGIPQEGLYLLTMSDISKIQLRAKLVVLSCSHSARGQIKAEGAVGIARAFLGSGARSVLVSLWALDDKAAATLQLMTHFYDHLVAGESAGESLHEAMKWMRSAGYDMNQWAPFILIGDDVTFDFEKKGKIQCCVFSCKGRLVLTHNFPEEMLSITLSVFSKTCEASISIFSFPENLLFDLLGLMYFILQIFLVLSMVPSVSGIKLQNVQCNVQQFKKKKKGILLISRICRYFCTTFLDRYADFVQNWQEYFDIMLDHWAKFVLIAIVKGK